MPPDGGHFMYELFCNFFMDYYLNANDEICEESCLGIREKINNDLAVAMASGMSDLEFGLARTSIDEALAQITNVFQLNDKVFIARIYIEENLRNFDESLVCEGVGEAVTEFDNFIAQAQEYFLKTRSTSLVLELLGEIREEIDPDIYEDYIDALNTPIRAGGNHSLKIIN